MPKQNAIALLKQDHATVRSLLEELAATTGRSAQKRTTLLSKITTEVQVHTQIEEEIFYPAFRDAVKKKEDAKLYFEALEEHHVVDLVLPEIQKVDPSAEEFAAKAKVLKDLIEHHAKEEEKEMFPRARQVMDQEQLEELGVRLQERKGTALTREVRQAVQEIKRGLGGTV